MMLEISNAAESAAAKEIDMCEERALRRRIGTDDIPTPSLGHFVQELVNKETAELRKWKDEDPRMLREQIRVADVAYNYLHAEHKKLKAELDAIRLRSLDPVKNQ